VADRALGRQQVGVIAGLLLLAAGLFLWLYYGASWLAAGLIAGGLLWLALALRSLGRLVLRSTYRRERWRRRDVIAAAAALATGAAWVALRLLRTGGLVYNPYPVVSMPAVAAPVALLVLGLAVPALLRPRAGEGRAPRPQQARRTAASKLPPTEVEAPALVQDTV
jgi:hypothetical protein